MLPLLNRTIDVVRSLRALQFRQLLRLPSVLERRERWVLFAGAVALVVGLALTGAAWYRGRTELRPAVGGTYVEGLLGAPHFVNPIFAPANDVDRDLVRLLFAGLFRTDDRGEVVPDLAERFEVSSDGKSVIVALPHGVRWHDGAELTADDVLFTIHLIQDPNAASPLRGAFRGVTVERMDEWTVRFQIDRPLAIFLSALTVGLLPEHLWADLPPSHLPLADLNLRPVGAGPYRFIGFTKDRRGGIRSFTVERYPGYHRSPPLLERITFHFATDTNQLLRALDAREIDGVGTFLPSAAVAIARRDVTRYPVRLPQTTALFLNPKRNDALRDPAVRRALSFAIDRRAVINAALGGAGEPIGGPIIPGFSPTADPPAPDPVELDRAARILDQANWAHVDAATLVAMQTRTELQKLDAEKRKAAGSGTRMKTRPPSAIPPATEEELRDIAGRVQRAVDDCPSCVPFPYHRVKDGDALAVRITTPDAPELVAAAERIRDAWRAVGVRATVDAVPLERVRGEVIPNRAYDALLFSQILGPDPDPFPFWHSSQVRHPGLNLSYFSNRAIDRLLEEARATTDHALRAQRYAAFQRMLAEERPAIFLSTPTLTYAIADAVRGVRLGQLTQPADRFTTISEWYIETERAWRSR